MVDKSIIEAYMAQDATKGAIALNAYAYGDWNAETTVRRLGTGKDELTLLGMDDPIIAKDAKAQTLQNGDGNGRQIYMRDMGDGEGDILNMAVTLQHEAYRDGIGGPENEAETYAAALAHTKMAIGIMNDGKKGFLDADLIGDITALRNGSFAQHVATSYDSSADYWRVTKDKYGKVIRVQDDGDRNHITYVDEDGRMLNQVEFDGNGLSSIIASSTSGKQTYDEINSIMWKSGLDYGIDEKNPLLPKHWYVRNSDGYYLRPELRGKMLEKQAEEAAKKKAAEEAARKAWEESHKDILSRFDPSNPITAGILKQTDEYFENGYKDIYNSGCFFMSDLALAQIAAGKTFDAPGVAGIWDDAVKASCFNDSGDLARFSKVASIALGKLGISDYGFEIDTNSYNGSLVAYIGRMPYGTGYHFALYLTMADNKHPYYNPGQTNNDVGLWRPVYLYPTTTKK
jgi:hypothetical protein